MALALKPSTRSLQERIDDVFVAARGAVVNGFDVKLEIRRYTFDDANHMIALEAKKEF